AQTVGQRIEGVLQLFIKGHGRWTGPLGSAPALGRLGCFALCGSTRREVKPVERDNSSRWNSLTKAWAGPYNDRVQSARAWHCSKAPPMWGRYGFDGGKDSRDACRAPSPR